MATSGRGGSLSGGGGPALRFPDSDSNLLVYSGSATGFSLIAAVVGAVLHPEMTITASNKM
jgi:hypothetical protein